MQAEQPASPLRGAAPNTPVGRTDSRTEGGPLERSGRLLAPRALAGLAILTVAVIAGVAALGEWIRSHLIAEQRAAFADAVSGYAVRLSAAVNVREGVARGLSAFVTSQFDSSAGTTHGLPPEFDHDFDIFSTTLRQSVAGIRS